jgi:hypothetical protein
MRERRALGPGVYVPQHRIPSSWGEGQAGGQKPAFGSSSSPVRCLIDPTAWIHCPEQNAFAAKLRLGLVGIASKPLASGCPGCRSQLYHIDRHWLLPCCWRALQKPCCRSHPGCRRSAKWPRPRVPFCNPAGLLGFRRLAELRDYPATRYVQSGLVWGCVCTSCWLRGRTFRHADVTPIAGWSCTAMNLASLAIVFQLTD